MHGNQFKTAMKVLFTAAAILGPLSAFAQSISLIEVTNTVWRYQTNRVDPGYADAWVAPGFDDSGWVMGKGLFGTEPTIANYAPWTINTPIIPPQSGAGVISSYFRTHFNWAGNPQGVSLLISNYVDDGILVYLNGVELFGFNVPATRPLPWDTLTLPSGANPLGEGVPFVTNVVPANLVQGDNVLAVALHQQANTTSDDVFGMSMKGIVPFAPTNYAPNQPTNFTLLQNRSALLSVSMDASPAPEYQWFVDDTLIPDATNSTHLITNELATTSVSNYFVRASNPLGTIYSRTNVVTFTADTEPPTVMVLSTLDGAAIIARFSEKVEAVDAVDTFNYSSPDFTITDTAGILQANQTDVLFHITPAMAVGSSHPMSISGVRDLVGTAMVETQLMVKAHVITHGSARYDYYLGLPKGTVALGDMTGAPAYPYSPNFTRFKNILELNTADEFDGYGTRLTGFLIPPTSGDYVFYFHSDDNGEFWLSTDASPANRMLLCNEPVWANRGEWTGAGGGGGRVGVPSASGGPQANISTNITLTAGQMYYFEALMKEGGGGDNMGVNWKPPGGAEPVNGTPSAIPSSAIASLADPVSQASNVNGPRITVALSGSQLTISWPVAGYRLQSKSTLGTPGGWADVPNGSTSPVTLTIGTGNLFFQLTQ